MADVASTLKDFFARSRLPVLFAGAVVSARAGLPAWPDYLRELASAVALYDQTTKYLIDHEVQAGDLGNAAAYYMMCREMPEATNAGGDKTA